MKRIGLNLALLAVDASYRNSGVSAYSWRLTRSLAQYDHDHSYTLFHGLADSAILPKFVHPVESHSVAMFKLHPRAHILWERTLLPLAVRDCDLCHFPVNVIPPGLPCPAVVTVHDLAFLREPEVVAPRRRWYLAAAIGASIQRAALVLAVSKQTRDDLLATWPIRPERIRVVHHAIDPIYQPSADAAAPLAWRVAHGRARPFLLSLGTIEPRKNLLMLVRAFARIAPEVDVDLVLAGATDWEGGRYADTVRRLIVELGLADRVIMTGYVPAADQVWWYRSALALVMPSLTEGFGLPAAEAMECGTPVITTNCGALPEVVGPGGLCLAPRNEADWSAVLTAICNAPAWRAELAHQAVAQGQRFTEARMASEVSAIYDEVLAQSAGFVAQAHTEIGPLAS